MQTILVAIKDAHRRRTVVQAVREAQPGAGIREVSTLEDIPSLVQAVQPDVLITALDSERHATLRLLDDMHVLCPQVSCVVVCRMEDFELVRNAATRAGVKLVLSINSCPTMQISPPIRNAFKKITANPSVPTFFRNDCFMHRDVVQYGR